MPTRQLSWTGERSCERQGSRRKKISDLAQSEDARILFRRKIAAEVPTPALLNFGSTCSFLLLPCCYQEGLRLPGETGGGWCIVLNTRYAHVHTIQYAVGLASGGCR